MRHTKTRSAAKNRVVMMTLVIGALSLRSSLVFAADSSETERARALFEEAGELERHGQWGAAQDRLRGALKLRETPQLYYALGWALENDDKLLEAKTEYEMAARLGRDKPNPGAEETTRLATVRLVDLDRKMPLIKVHVVGAAKSTTRVMVDGREVKRGDDDIATTAVNPGSHVIRVDRGPDMAAIEQMVYVGRSTIQTVDVDANDNTNSNALVAKSDSAQDRHGGARSPIVISSEDKSTKSDRVMPWVLVSGGVVMLASSAALFFSSSKDADTRDADQAKWCATTACVGTKATRTETAEATSFRQASTDAADRGNTKQAIGFVVGGAGVVTAAVGAILLLRHTSNDNTTTTEKLAHARTHASVAPTPGGAFGNIGFAF